MLSQVNARCVRCDALNITDVCHPIQLVNEFVGPHFDLRVRVPRCKCGMLEWNSAFVDSRSSCAVQPDGTILHIWNDDACDEMMG